MRGTMRALAAVFPMLLAQETQAHKDAIDYSEAMKLNNIHRGGVMPIFRGSGISPKDYGLYIATRNSHKAKSKTKSRKAGF